MHLDILNKTPRRRKYPRASSGGPGWRFSEIRMLFSFHPVLAADLTITEGFIILIVAVIYLAPSLIAERRQSPRGPEPSSPSISFSAGRSLVGSLLSCGRLQRSRRRHLSRWTLRRALDAPRRVKAAAQCAGFAGTRSPPPHPAPYRVRRAGAIAVGHSSAIVGRLGGENLALTSCTYPTAWIDSIFPRVGRTEPPQVVETEFCLAAMNQPSGTSNAGSLNALVTSSRSRAGEAGKQHRCSPDLASGTLGSALSPERSPVVRNGRARSP